MRIPIYAPAGIAFTDELQSGGERYHAFGCNTTGQLGLKGLHSRKKPEARAFGGPKVGHVFCGGNSTFFTCLADNESLTQASGLIELRSQGPWFWWLGNVAGYFRGRVMTMLMVMAMLMLMVVC